MSTLDWDDFRARYRDMSLDEQRIFYEQVVHDYPIQRHYNSQAVLRFLRDTHPWVVVEVGGWDGALSLGMLGLTPIIGWTNYEIAPIKPVNHDPRYRHVQIECWPWEMEKLDGDALILSHVVEHMLLDQFGALIEKFDGDAVYIDCPVTTGPQDWTGYPGTHVIERGWDGIEERLVGFQRLTPEGQQRWYARTPRAFVQAAS